MRLAMLGNGAGEPRLVVVSSDLTRCTDARRIAPTLAAALADWAHLAPELEALARDLDLGAVPMERFHEHDARPPLPAAPLLLADDGTWRDLSATTRLGARDPLPAAAATVRPAVTVVAGSPASDAGAVRLIGAAAVVDEGRAIAFAPVMATPVALGGAWAAGRLRHPPELGRGRGEAEAAAEPDFAALLAEAERTGALATGALLMAATAPACAAVPGMVRLAARDASGHTLFGAIEPETARAPAHA